MAGKPRGQTGTEVAICGQPKKSNHQPCTQPAGLRTDHPGYGWCYLHLGKTPRGKQWAAKLKAEAELSAEYDRLGVPRDVNPIAALEEMLAVSAGAELFWRRKVSELEPRVSDDGMSVGGPDHLGDSRAHLFVVKWEASVERTANLAALAIKAGLEERKVAALTRGIELQVGMLLLAMERSGVDVGARELIEAELERLWVAETGTPLALPGVVDVEVDE